jgi:lysozyme family protein
MNTPEYEISYKRLIDIEGGYVFDPDDPGGETYKGISRVNWPDWEGWDIIDEYKFINSFKEMEQDSRLTESTKNFYKTYYWQVIKGDHFEFEVAFKLFDIAVNMGTGIAGTILQRSLNLLNRNQILYPDIPVDGSIGPMTITAYNSLPHKDVPYLIQLIKGIQLCRYVDITEDRETLEKFIRGWLNRV